MSGQTSRVTEFQAGSVFGRSLSILRKNIVPFGLLALVLTSPPTIYAWVTANPSESASAGADWSSWLVYVLGFLLGYLVHAALVYGTVRELRGCHASFGDCIGGGLAVILPVIGVAIVTWLATAIPVFLIETVAVSRWLSALAIVIGVVVMILLWVAVPAAVVERHGVLASLSRSLELTKGSRWKILVIFLLLGGWVLVVALFFGVILTSELGSAVGAGSNLVILAGFIVIPACIK